MKALSLGLVKGNIDELLYVMTGRAVGDEGSKPGSSEGQY